MSDILIKAMEMPKDKPICIIIDPAGQARRYDLNNDKYADDELFEAVSVPPHGKLGDLDRLAKEVKDMEKEFPPDSISAERYRLFAEFIKTAPTIIETELPIYHGTFAATSGQEAIRYLTGEDET